MSENVKIEVQLKTKKDLNSFLNNIKDQLVSEDISPIYAMSALNSALKLDKIYTLLDQSNKEIARDIWIRLKKSGFQLDNPPLLFDAEEEISILDI